MPTGEYDRSEEKISATALEEIHMMLTESAKRETAIMGMITEMRQALIALKAEVDKKSDKEDAENIKNRIYRIDQELSSFEKVAGKNFKVIASGIGEQSGEIHNKIVEAANHVVDQTEALLNYAEARLTQKVEEKGEEIDRHVKSLHVKLDQKF